MRTAQCLLVLLSLNVAVSVGADDGNSSNPSAQPRIGADLPKGGKAVSPRGLDREVGSPVATVNGVPIVKHQLNDITDAVCKQRTTGCSPLRWKMVRQQMLEHLVGEVLLDEEARRQNIQVTSEEVDASYAKLRSEIGGEEKVQQLLTASGRTLREFRQELARGVAREKVLAPILEKAGTGESDPVKADKLKSDAAQAYLMSLREKAVIVQYE